MVVRPLAINTVVMKHRVRCFALLAIVLTLGTIVSALWQVFQTERLFTSTSFSQRTEHNGKSFDALWNASQRLLTTPAQANDKTDQSLGKYFRDNFNKTLSTEVDFGPDNVSDATKYLIYRCDADTLLSNCGGWADRVKGMLSGYLIANLTGRVFKIEVLSPTCDLQQMLVPNHVDWLLPVSFHSEVKPSKDVQIVNYRNNETFFKDALTIDFRSMPEMAAKYVYFKYNLDFMMQLRKAKRYQKELAWMRNMTRDQINAAIYKLLFKPSTKMHTKLSQFFSANLNRSDTLLCAHVRTGRNPSLPHDNAIRVKQDQLLGIWNLLHEVSRGAGDHKIFLMTDSENVIIDAERQSFRDRLITSQGPIVHIAHREDFTTNEMCMGLEKVIFEQLILMHCDVLVISKSGLSRMATYIRGSNRGLYCILPSGHVVPCDKSKLQELYQIYG